MESQHLKNIHPPPLPFDLILPICMHKKEMAASQSRGHKSHSLIATNWEWDV